MSTTLLNKFPTRFKSAREARGLSQADLAKKIGVSGASAVHAWEKGGRVEMEKLPAIATILDVSIDWLFGLSDQPKPPNGFVIPDIPRRLMEGLNATAVARGFGSPEEFVRHLIRDAVTNPTDVQIASGLDGALKPGKK